MRILLPVKTLQQHAKKRPAVFPVAVVLLSCLGLSACAGKHFNTFLKPDAWLQDKQGVLASMQTLQSEQQTLQSELQSTQDTQQSIQDDIRTLQKHLTEIEQKQTEQSAMLNAEHASIRQLQNSTIHLKAIAAKSKKSSQISKQKLVKKIDKIAKTILKPVSAIPAPSTEKEKNHYTAAYLALKSGNYDKATRGFRDFLKEFPKGKYRDQAWYWLGESYDAQRKTRQAIAAFEKVIKNYPDSTKHATAMLSLSRAYREASRPKNASSTLQLLIQKYPDSTAAEQARRQLKSMQKKGQ